MRSPNGSAHARWVRSREVLWRQAPGALVLLAGRDEPFVVRGPGPLVWDLLDEPIETSEVLQIVAAAHGVAGDDIAQDLSTLLDDLERRGAIARL